MRRVPFRLRIALLSALVSGTVLVAAGSVAWFWMARDRLEALDREIRTLAYRHPGWMTGRANFERLTGAIEFIFGDDRQQQLLLLVQGGDGTIRYQSDHWPADLDLDTLGLDRDPAPPAPGRPSTEPSSPAESGAASGPGRRGPPWANGRYADPSGPIFSRPARFLTVHTPTTSWRFGILGNDRDRLAIGLDYSDLHTELNRLRNRFLTALPPALFLIGLGGWLVAGSALRPLQSIRRTAEQVSARGLDQRIPSTAEDPEIAALIGVLNGMMDRLEASFRQAIRFSADASHELKTPLTIMQGELENALQQAAPGSQEQAVYANLLEATQRLKAITQSLLLLARADAGQLPLRMEPLNLPAVVEELVEDARILGEDADLSIDFTCSDRKPPPVPADRALLRLALANLLDNAVKYNRPGGRVEVALATEPLAVRLRVANTGPGVPPGAADHLFERFYRADSARAGSTGGAGLGLSLGREIVHAHQGTLTLVESRADWTVFELMLPAPPETSVTPL